MIYDTYDSSIVIIKLSILVYTVVLIFVCHLETCTRNNLIFASYVYHYYFFFARDLF